jgi:3-dehydroquinate synthase/shikimate kinase/3-dehydroquinate synthase
LGIKTASKFSVLNKLLKISEFRLIENHLNKLNLPNNINNFFTNNNLNKIMYFMQKDKKNNSKKKINLVLLNKIGHPLYNSQFKEKKISLFLKKELIK